MIQFKRKFNHWYLSNQKSAKKVSKKDRNDFFIKNWKYDSINCSFILFTIKFNSKDYLISIFSQIFNSKDCLIIFFSGEFNSKNDSKIWIWMYSMQQNIHSIKNPRYRPPRLDPAWQVFLLLATKKLSNYCLWLCRWHRWRKWFWNRTSPNAVDDVLLLVVPLRPLEVWTDDVDWGCRAAMEVGCSKDRSQKMFFQPSLHNINDVVRVWNVKPKIRLVESWRNSVINIQGVFFDWSALKDD